MGRPDEIRRVLLDASCLIGVIQGDQFYAPLRTLLAAIDRGEITLVESTAILAEVLPSHPGSGGDEKRQDILQLLDSPDVHYVDVSTVVARKAAQLRVTYGLKTWDAVHLASGICAKVDVVFVRDSKFPTGQTVEGVYVSEPFDIDDDKLPLESSSRTSGEPEVGESNGPESPSAS